MARWIGSKLKDEPECGFCGKFLTDFAGSMADILNTCTCPILSSSSIESINNDFSSGLYDIPPWQSESFPHLRAFSQGLSCPQILDNLSRTEYIPEYNTCDPSALNGLVAYNDARSYSRISNPPGPNSYDAGVYETPASVCFDDEERSCLACKKQPSGVYSKACSSLPAGTNSPVRDEGPDNCIINCWYDKKNNSLICSYEPKDERDSDASKSCDSESFCSQKDELFFCSDDENDDFPSGRFSLKLTTKNQNSSNPCSRFFGPSQSYLGKHRKAIDMGRRDTAWLRKTDNQDECSLNISLYSAGGCIDPRQLRTKIYKKYRGEEARHNIKDFIERKKKEIVKSVSRKDESWLQRAKEAVARYVYDMEGNLKKDGKEDSPGKTEVRRAKDSPEKEMVSDEENLKAEVQNCEVHANCFGEEKEAESECVSENEANERKEMDAENEENERRENEVKEACIKCLGEIEENVQRDKREKKEIAKHLTDCEDNLRKEKTSEEMLAECIAKKKARSRRESKTKETKHVVESKENTRRDIQAIEMLTKCGSKKEENLKREKLAANNTGCLAEKKENERKEKETKDVYIHCTLEDESKENGEEQITAAISPCIAENDEDEKEERKVKGAFAECIAQREVREITAKCKAKKEAAERKENDADDAFFECIAVKETNRLRECAGNEVLAVCIADTLRTKMTEGDRKCTTEEFREKFAAENYADGWCKQEEVKLGRQDSEKSKDLSLFSLKGSGVEKRSKNDKKPKCTGRICHSKVCSELCNLLTEKESERIGEKHDSLCKASAPETEKKRDRRCNHSTEQWAEEKSVRNQKEFPETPSKNLQSKVSFKDCPVEQVPAKASDLSNCEPEPCKKNAKKSNFCQTSVHKLREAKRRAKARKEAKKRAAQLNKREKNSNDGLKSSCLRASASERSKTECGRRVCKSPEKSRQKLAKDRKSQDSRRTSCSPEKSRRRSQHSCRSSSGCSSGRSRRKGHCSASDCSRRRNQKSCAPPSCILDTSRAKSPQDSYLRPSHSPARLRRKSRQKSCSSGKSRSCSPSRGSIINKDPCFEMALESEPTDLMPVKQCWSKRSSREIIEDAIRKLEDIEKKSLSGIVTPPRVCSEEPEFYEAIDSAHMNTSESNSPRDPSVDVERGRRPSNSRTPSCISPRDRDDRKERRKASIPPCGKKDPCEKKRERCKAKARKQCRDKKCKTCGKKKERVTERS
nr:PREDICTED: uncharacterized protein LOC109042601 [Bemisia tabaci]